jgi:hypothetical protein
LILSPTTCCRSQNRLEVNPMKLCPRRSSYSI